MAGRLGEQAPHGARDDAAFVGEVKVDVARRGLPVHREHPKQLDSSSADSRVLFAAWLAAMKPGPMERLQRKYGFLGLPLLRSPRFEEYYMYILRNFDYKNFNDLQGDMDDVRLYWEMNGDEIFMHDLKPTINPSDKSVNWGNGGTKYDHIEQKYLDESIRLKSLESESERQQFLESAEGKQMLAQFLESAEGKQMMAAALVEKEEANLDSAAGPSDGGRLDA